MGAFDDREQKDAAVKMVGELDAEIVVLKGERDAALAVIERAAKFEDTSPALNMGFYRIVGHMRAILESSPADALAEVKADAWNEGAKWAGVELGTYPHDLVSWLSPGDNPYRKAT